MRRSIGRSLRLLRSWRGRTACAVATGGRCENRRGADEEDDQPARRGHRTDATSPAIDEPAAGLNPRESAALNDLLRYIRDETKCAVLLIEHDMIVVMEISDHLIVLDYGRKIAEGAPEAVRNDPAVIRAYLGEEEDEALPAVVARDLASELPPEELPPERP